MASCRFLQGPSHKSWWVITISTRSHFDFSYNYFYKSFCFANQVIKANCQIGQLHWNCSILMLSNGRNSSEDLRVFSIVNVSPSSSYWTGLVITQRNRWKFFSSISRICCKKQYFIMHKLFLVWGKRVPCMIHQKTQKLWDIDQKTWVTFGLWWAEDACI